MSHDLINLATDPDGQVQPYQKPWTDNHETAPVPQVNERDKFLRDNEQRGQALSALVYTAEGQQLATTALSSLTAAINETHPFQSSNTTAVAEDASKVAHIRDQDVARRQQQLESDERAARSIMAKLSTAGQGLFQANNIVAEALLRSHFGSEYRRSIGKSLSPEHQQWLVTFESLCRDIHFASEYTARQDSQADQTPLPGQEPGTGQLRFTGSNIKEAREAFRRGWDSVRTSIQLPPMSP